MKDKVVLITGATAGIGEACAHKFAAAGCRLIITGRRNDRLANLEKVLKEQYGNEVLVRCFDVRNREETLQQLNNLPHAFEQVDVLINNAGLASGFGPIQDGDFDDWDRMIDTNVKGLLNVSKVIMQGMVSRKKGHIINIASIAGKEAYPNGNVYCASKHAVDALSKTMRIDLLPHGIRVTNIAPGMAETEFSLVRFHGDAGRAANVYKGIEPLTGKDIAEVVFFTAALPENINLNDIVITPRFQANATQAIRNA
jgi:3-hydroxy acid dehydrogenase / malonic semialdehyde reductase